jgi:hypothetical protein
MKWIANINMKLFCKNVFARILVPILIISCTCLIITHYCHNPYRLLITISTSILTGMISIWFTSLSSEEKTYVYHLLKKCNV